MRSLLSSLDRLGRVKTPPATVRDGTKTWHDPNRIRPLVAFFSTIPRSLAGARLLRNFSDLT